MNIKYASLALVLATACLLAKAGLKLHKNDSDIDRLEQLLIPVKKQMTHGSVIGWDTNITDDSRLHELYFKTVFALSPSLAVWGDDGRAMHYDTLLSISDPSLPAKKYDNYRCISTAGFEGLGYALLVLKK